MRYSVPAVLSLSIWLAAANVPVAFAQVPDTALRAFNDGKFFTAATIAEADGEADALAFAARARIADAVTRGRKFCLECLVQAEATAEEAIKRDPNLAEGYVQLAIALGFRGRLISVLEAQAEGLAEKGRAAVDKALELDPSNNWARASLGGWHLEVVHRAGSVLASVMYGASEEEGLKNFRQALAAEPDSLLLHFHFSLSILALDVDRFRGEAADALENGMKDQSSDALTRMMRELAQELLATVRKGNSEEIATLVHRLQGYADGVETTLPQPN